MPLNNETMAALSNRREFLKNLGAGSAGLAVLSGCGDRAEPTRANPYSFDVSRDYADEAFEVMRVRRSKFEPRLHPSLVSSPFSESAGTLIVQTAQNYIYLQAGNGMAFRYGVGVGRRGVAWSGTAQVAIKRKWPVWNPTPRMRAEEPGLPAYVEAGPHNPLGARALYLFRGGVDTLYRIHGTSEPWTIGTRASSGCIRMLNEDIIDLYDRVALNSTVIVT